MTGQLCISVTRKQRGRMRSGVPVRVVRSSCPAIHFRFRPSVKVATCTTGSTYIQSKLQGKAKMTPETTTTATAAVADTPWREHHIHHVGNDDTNNNSAGDTCDDDEGEREAQQAQLDLFAPAEEQYEAHHYSFPVGMGSDNDDKTTVDCTVYGQAEHTSTGLALWNGSIEMAQHLARNPQLVRQKRILELGAGLGLCGIVASKLGAAEITITDGDFKVLENLRRNVQENSSKDAEANQCNITCPQLIFGHNLEKFMSPQSPVTRGERYQVIMAADVAYMSKSVEPLWQTVDRCLCRDEEDGLFIYCWKSFTQDGIEFFLDHARKFGFHWTFASENTLHFRRKKKEDAAEAIHVYYIIYAKTVTQSWTVPTDEYDNALKRLNVPTSTPRGSLYSTDHPLRVRRNMPLQVRRAAFVSLQVPGPLNAYAIMAKGNLPVIVIPEAQRGGGNLELLVSLYTYKKVIGQSVDITDLERTEIRSLDDTDLRASRLHFGILPSWNPLGPQLNNKRMAALGITKIIGSPPFKDSSDEEKKSFAVALNAGLPEGTLAYQRPNRGDIYIRLPEAKRDTAGLKATYKELEWTWHTST